MRIACALSVPVLLRQASSSADFSGFAAAQRSKAFFHFLYARARFAAILAKYSRVWPLTKNFSSGSESALRAASANLPPLSPWPLAEFSTSGIPLAITVLKITNFGLSDAEFFTLRRALRTAEMSCPSAVVTSQPSDLKRMAVFSDIDFELSASSVTSLESYRSAKFPSFKLPASAAASEEIPS